jgi:DNA-binding PadR family transcriptional regulator
MIVATALLASLAGGPMHIGALHRHLAPRLAPFRGLAIAQVRTTLRRLVRRGLVAEGTPDACGRAPFSLTRGGERHLDAWLTAPPHWRQAPSEMVARLALLHETSTADIFGAAIQMQRAALRHRRAMLDRAPRSIATTHTAGLARAYLDIDLAWLDELAATVTD